jgi:uncharacterized protein (TIGR02996 family)
VTLTTTIAAMLAAVRESPDDDTPRLALADALDETDPDEGGDAGWAEFLRVQVELARTPPCGHLPGAVWCTRCLEDSPQVVLRRKAAELRTAHEARWRRGPACERCGGSARVFTDDEAAMQHYEGATGNLRPYLLDINCPACHGSGWTGPLGDREPGGDARYGGQAGGASRWRVPATFRRGFIHRISTPLADVFAGDDVTEWAKRVARWPCVCLEEWACPWDDGNVVRHRRGHWLILWSTLPLSLGRWLREHKDDRHDTEAAARHAIAVAVAAVVNEAALKGARR